ncbi:Uncharacterised protein [Serratia fonticola]|uniref:Uncharacterized protein n=1 Tax=Serratia fonticola TaxID=47917 RepID=A0A4U9UD90_SERFO|nr:Uncharacterised protein [Serratia fonticola]
MNDNNNPDLLHHPFSRRKANQNRLGYRLFTGRHFGAGVTLP